MLVYYYGIVGSRDVMNDGNTIALAGDYGYITIKDKEGDDRKFLTNRIEFHMPSEHWFNDYPSQMELQIFHTVDDSDFTVDFPSTAIVSVMIRPGDDNYFMQAISLENLPKSGSNHTLATNALVNLLDIVDPYDDYYFYMGSLSTPECQEDVIRYVFKDEQMVSFNQMDYFKRLWIEDTGFSNGNGNVRTIQDKNGRDVKYSSALSVVFSLSLISLWI